VDKNTKKKLEEANWREITPKLAKYALYKVKWLREARDIPDYGYISDIVDEVVSSSIQKVFDGTVLWDPATKPDLAIFMISVVKSTISHLYDKKEHKTTSRFPSVQAANAANPVEVEELLDIASSNEDHANHLPVSPTKPDEVLIAKQNMERENAILEELLLECDGDTELEDILLCIMSGFSKRRDIAKQMGVDESQVTNIKKRLIRKLHKFLQKKRSEDDTKT
jgi:DNA-directed RNA polymerase specialized sigma24 family protein